MRNMVLANYKRNAKSKGYPWEISDEVAINLFSGKCYYCGTSPGNVCENKNSNGAFIYNGIDRLQNAIGYIEGNVVSCCTECNFRKGVTDVEDFLSWVQRVAHNRCS